MKVKRLILLMLVLGFIAAMAFAVENKGAKDLLLDGGKRGKVPFPHHQHQNTLVDCKICHTQFPQEKGSIKKLKSEGKLAKKHVMNKLCTNCHREKKKAGEKSGPTICSKCHIK